MIDPSAVIDLVETLRTGMVLFLIQSCSVQRHRAVVDALEALLDGDLIA